jgi:predicted HTH transcriptional regulator
VTLSRLSNLHVINHRDLFIGIRAVVEAGLAEHSQLEYKSKLYDDGDRGTREFLQDIGMFANSEGGILLIGVSERRGDGQPTGVPDAHAELGIEIANPEAVLAAYRHKQKKTHDPLCQRPISTIRS